MTLFLTCLWPNDRIIPNEMTIVASRYDIPDIQCANVLERNEDLRCQNGLKNIFELFQNVFFELGGLEYHSINCSICEWMYIGLCSESYRIIAYGYSNTTSYQQNCALYHNNGADKSIGIFTAVLQVCNFLVIWQIHFVQPYFVFPL